MTTTVRGRDNTVRICFLGLMAAIVFVVNYLRIPFMGTQLHMTNALCALCGLLFGPGAGFLAAGLGSGLYDIVAGWGAECVITFVNKGVIALIAGLIAGSACRKDALARADYVRITVGCVLGSLAYVALYMLRSLARRRHPEHALQAARQPDQRRVRVHRRADPVLRAAPRAAPCRTV